MFGKDVTVVPKKRDRYGRELGKVLIGDRNINLEQLRAGMAWFYRHYEPDLEPGDRQTYDRAESEAKSAKRGLWSQPNPVPPWEWRADGRAATRTGPKPGEQFSTQSSPIPGIIGNKSWKIYHRPDCPGYKSVAPKNQVAFLTPEDAERAGYRMAGNCR